jgi:hypothetical protein
VPKPRNPKTEEKEREAREELQHPDMEKFDRAVRALLKVSQGRTHEKKSRARIASKSL